jgi:hypothetical protein
MNPSSPAFPAVLHDREDFYIKKRSKAFAITETPTATPIAAPVIVDRSLRESEGFRMGKRA